MAHICHYCNLRVIADAPHGSPYKETTDHYLPKSLLRHLQPVETVIACHRCNSMKGATPPEAFKRYIEMFGHQGLENKRAYRLFCYRLMAAGLRYSSVEDSMKEEFAWMIPSKNRSA